jgi:hypothetical protein
MIKYIYSFKDDDKILLEKETNIITIECCSINNSENSSDSYSDSDSSSCNDISYCIIKRIDDVIRERLLEKHNNKRKSHLISNI